MDTLKLWNSRRSMSSTYSTAARTSASTGSENSRSRRCLGSDPELTPMRSGVPSALARATTSAVFSGPPMLPGLIRTQCAPASSALIASVWLKWMSAITGIGDSATIVRSAATSCSRGTATRTMSAPASATRRIWSIVACTLAVSVFVIVCTATGAPPPIGTPPTWICRADAMGLQCIGPYPPLRARFAGRLRDRPRAPARAGARAAGGAGPRPPPRRVLRAHRSPARHADRRRRLWFARAARARARGRHHRRRPRPAPRLPWAVRAGRRDRAPPLRRRRVRPRLLVERHRARAARPARRVRRGAAPDRARLVRPDPGALVPARAARAAAVRALGAALAAPALLAAGRDGPLGGHQPPRPARARGPVRPGAARARRPAHEELGVRAARAPLSGLKSAPLPASARGLQALDEDAEPLARGAWRRRGADLDGRPVEVVVRARAR